MHAYIISGTNERDKTRTFEQICQKHLIENRPQFRYMLRAQEGESSRLPARQTIKIDDVRELQRWTAGIASGPRAVIVEQAHQLTEPAQQALLKTIEEPEEHTILILMAESDQSLLPTIRSRCKIVRTGPSASVLSGKIDFHKLPREPSDRILWLYRQLSSFSGKTISPHQGSIDRTTAQAFVDDLISELRTKMPGKNPVRLASALRLATETHKQLKQNISPALALQQLAMSI